MAAYIGPSGEVDAILLDEDRTFQPSGTIGKSGEWLIRDTDGQNRLCAKDVFTQYTQKFPRAVDAPANQLPSSGGKVA